MKQLEVDFLDFAFISNIFGFRNPVAAHQGMLQPFSPTSGFFVRYFLMVPSQVAMHLRHHDQNQPHAFPLPHSPNDLSVNIAMVIVFSGGVHVGVTVRDLSQGSLAAVHLDMYLAT